MDAFAPAPLDLYIEWLRGHVANGGRITHAYDYPFSRWGFLTAKRHFTTDGECGSQAVAIIAPSGVRHLGGNLGHNKLYFMDGFEQRGGLVPVYADPEFDALPGVADARLAAHQEARASSDPRTSHGSDVTAYQQSARTEHGRLQAAHRVHSDEPVTVNVEPDGTVVLLPRSMPLRLTPDEAETIAHRILAAARRPV